MATDYSKWIIPALTIGGSAIGAYANSRSRGKDRESNERLTAEELASRERQNLGNIAVTESGRDPFRDQMAQARSLSALDRLERGSYSPASMTPTGPYASYVPEFTGGYSYEKDPKLREMAAKLKADVATGRGAPTMTDPRNYGTTGAVNVSGQAPAGPPGQAVPRGGTSSGSRPAGGGGPLSYDTGDLEDQEGGEFDDILSYTGARNSRAGKTFGTAASGATTGMTFGGPIGAAIGGGAGLITGLITSGKNDTKGQREELAKRLGMNLGQLYDKLRTLGPEGERLADIGLNTIGRKDVQAQSIWNERVSQLLSRQQQPAA